MKKALTCLGIFVLTSIISSNVIAQSDSASLAARAKEMENKAMAVYTQTADSGISYFKQAAELYRMAKNNRSAAASLQNSAIVHEQIRKDNFKSMEVMKESILLWRLTKDSAGTANAYKYIISQHAKMNDNLNATRKADTAIRYYTALKDNKNAASVYLIISSMYENQRMLDSAVKFAQKAYDVQKKDKKSDAALYSINNALFRIYTLNGNMEAAQELLKKNQKGLKTAGLNNTDKMNFYYYSWVFYTKANEVDKATEAKAKYDALRNSTK